MKTAILIPCYNEAKTIEKVIKDFKKSMPNAVIYVYDNNSTDGTDEIAREAGAIVRYEYKQGKGNVVRRMFREIDADCYILHSRLTSRGTTMLKRRNPHRIRNKQHFGLEL
ncbi:Glycosyl transferase family 2, partial [Eubacterium aggregans]